MITNFISLNPADTLAKAVNLVLSGSQKDFPVVDNGRLAGMVKKNDLMLALSRGDINEYVGNVMNTNIQSTSPDELLNRAIGLLHNKEFNTIPVVISGALRYVNHRIPNRAA